MTRRYWLILLAMALLTPLGLLADGTAWGEWGAEDLAGMLGFAPPGIEQAETWWRALFPDYAVKGLGEKTGYIVSALLGSALAYLAAMAYTKTLARRK
jgi:hypothetical protein